MNDITTLVFCYDVIEPYSSSLFLLKLQSTMRWIIYRGVFSWFFQKLYAIFRFTNMKLTRFSCENTSGIEIRILLILLQKLEFYYKKYSTPLCLAMTQGRGISYK